MSSSISSSPPCSGAGLQQLKRLHLGASLSDAYIEMEEISGASSWEGLLKGRVSGIEFEVPPAAYEIECFEYGCFDTAGIWTEAPIDSVPPWFVDNNYTAYYPGCFSPDCFEPFRFTCELYVQGGEDECFVEDAFEDNAYQDTNVYRATYVMAPPGTPCFPPSSGSSSLESPPPTYGGEAYWWSRSLGTIYRDIEGMTLSFPAYIGAQEEGVYEPCTFISPEGDWLVVNASAYEVGAFEPAAYEPSVFFLFREKQEEPACYEDCALSLWQLIGVYSCPPLLPLEGEGDISSYPHLVLSESPPTLTWEEHILLGLPGPVEVAPGVTLYSTFSSPYEGDVFGEEAYGNYLFIWADYPPFNGEAYEEGAYNPRPLALLDMDGMRLTRVYVPIQFEFAVARLEYCYFNCPLPSLPQESCQYSIDPYGAIAILRLLSPCSPPPPAPVLGGCGCYSPPPEEYGGRFAHRWYWDGSSWSSQWFVPGWGTGGAAYVVDLGYIYFCWDAMIIEEFVPLRAGGQFISEGRLLPKPKYARLMRVTPYSVEKVAESWGHFPLPRTGATLGGGGSLGGETLVKDIALSIIRLLMSNCRPRESCTYEWGEGAPYFLPYAESVMTHLLSLLSREEDDSFGSIPERVYQGSTYESLYGERATCPTPYVAGAFQGGCEEEPLWDEEYDVDDDADHADYCAMPCFEPGKIEPRLSLSVDTETVAWVALAATILAEISPSSPWKKTAIDSISAAFSFLRRAKETPSGLAIDTFNPSTLLWGGQHSLRTSVITLLALSKGYDLFSDPWMIEAAAKLHQATLNGLYAPSVRMYASSYENQEPDGFLYGLIHSLLFVRSEATESCLSLIAARGKLHQRVPRSIAGLNLFAYIESPPAGRYPMLYGGGDFEYVLLRLSLHGATKSDFKNPVEPLLKKRQDQFYEPTLLSVVGTLSEEGESIVHELIRPRCLGEVERLGLYYQLSYNKLVSMWPIDFQSWASTSAVKEGGNISRVLRASASAISTWYALLRTRTLGVYAKEAGGIYLDEWGLDVGLPRRPGEYDSIYRGRILSSLSGSCDSYEDAIEAKALSWGYEDPTVIEYPAQSTPSWRRPFFYEPRVGLGILHGGLSIRPSYALSMEGVLSEPDLLRIDGSRAGGVVGWYRDSITILSDCVGDKRNKETLGLTHPGGMSPRVKVEDLCCVAGGCSILVRITINGPYNDVVYVWREGSTYQSGFTVPGGVTPLAAVGAGENILVTLIAPPP